MMVFLPRKKRGRVARFPVFIDPNFFFHKVWKKKEPSPPPFLFLVAFGFQSYKKNSKSEELHNTQP
jgi:hypothetical protein